MLLVLWHLHIKISKITVTVFNSAKLPQWTSEILSLEGCDCFRSRKYDYFWYSSILLSQHWLDRDTDRNARIEKERAAASLQMKANFLQSSAPLCSLPHTSYGPLCTTRGVSYRAPNIHFSRHTNTGHSLETREGGYEAVCGRGNAFIAWDLTPPLYRSGTAEEGKAGSVGCAGRSGWV